uniref:Tail fiber protein n=2 Tax=Panagrellus redivivus TaxID=6233 RepID=A0A7E4ZQK2_PANRE
MLYRSVIFSLLFTACIAEEYCPDRWVLGRYPYGNFCHRTISRYEVSTGEPTYIQADNWCRSQVGGRLASIHSDAENNIYRVNQIVMPSQLKGGAIGLIAEDGQSDTASNTRWLDGTPVTYNKIHVGTATQFNVTLLGYTGQWNTKVPAYNIQLAFRYIHCKMDALIR